MKTRTTSFPKMSLVSARKVMEGALKFGKNWTKEEFAGYGSKKGASSAKSGAFANRLAALKSYGLITTTKDAVFPTELCERLIHFVNEEERKTAYIAAFLNVDVFRKIYDESVHGEELSKDSIQSIAVTRYGVSRDPRTLAGFMHSFTTSGIESGLVSEVGSDAIIFQNNDIATKEEESAQINPDNNGVIKADTRSSEKQTTLVGNVLGGGVLQGQNVQGVDHVGSDWRLVVSFTSSLTIKSDVRKKIRDLIAQADEVADTFYELEEKGKEN